MNLKSNHIFYSAIRDKQSGNKGGIVEEQKQAAGQRYAPSIENTFAIGIYINYIYKSYHNDAANVYRKYHSLDEIIRTGCLSHSNRSRLHSSSMIK